MINRTPFFRAHPHDGSTSIYAQRYRFILGRQTAMKLLRNLEDGKASIKRYIQEVSMPLANRSRPVDWKVQFHVS